MPSIDPHPSPEQLVAYHERRLPEEEAEEIRAHLVACADCTVQLLGLADLLDGDENGAAGLSRADLDAAWRRQRERLPVAPLVSPAPVVSLEDRRAAKAPRRWSWATAASLGLAAALAGVVVAQWRTIERLEQPQVNLPLVNLAPLDSVRRGSREVAGELRFLKGAERAWVILNPGADPDSSLYDVRIATKTGAVVLVLQDLRITESGNVRLEIPRAVLSTGTYEIQLFKAGRHRILERFELEVLP